MIFNDPPESVWTDVGEAEYEEPEWVVDNILPVGITFIAGPPKSYKSTVELALLLTACGVENTVMPPDLSQCRDPGRVMMLSMEAQAGALRHTAKHGFNTDIPSDMRFLCMSDPWRFRLDQKQDVQELLGWMTELDAKVLAIDPLRNCHSLDENDSGGMVMMLQPVQQWAVKNRKSVVIVHHSKKLGEERDGGKRMANANDMRGSSALFGLADAVLTITGKGKGLVHIDAIMKRGEAWQRTIQLGIWGMSGVESITEDVRAVFDLVTLELTQAEIAAKLQISKTKVSECVTTLKRIGALTGSGTVSSNGLTIVKNAVRKFAPNT